MLSQNQEQVIALALAMKTMKIDPNQVLLDSLHLQYLENFIHNMGEKVVHFQYSQPWLYYYYTHSIKMLGAEIKQQTSNKIKQALKYCFSEGFGGGYKQLPHLAPTYAGFLAVLQLGPSAYSLLDNEKLYAFFKKMKKDNKFTINEQGQCDLRAIYIVTLITKTLKLNEDILEGVAETVLQSQTHEGGISNVIGGQAHGGFTYCGVAALSLLGRLQELNISRLMMWLSQRQLQFGGYNGRTNKLIDSCYSLWIGAIYNIVNNYFGNINFEGDLLYSQEDLQKYILFYCQDKKSGGLCDKPGKSKDCYHTTYALSGLSASQVNGHNLNGFNLVPIEPVYNVTKGSYDLAKEHWKF